MMSNIWIVAKAIFILIPFIVEMVQNGKIKTGAMDEVLAALNSQFSARIKRAQEAGEQEPIDESIDPNNRSR